MLYELKENAQNVLAYFTKRMTPKSANKDFSIGFICGFHDKSGGPVAISSIANGLSNSFNVNFELHPTSYYSRLLDNTVNFTKHLSTPQDLYIVDLSTNIDAVRQIKAYNKPVILTIHGLRNALHKLDNEHIDNMLALADEVHFVGQVQQDSYQLPPNKYFIISNSASEVSKTQQTNNIGVVGNLDEPRKNAELSVRIGLQSDCDQIHLWSTSKTYSSDPRVIHHEWEHDKQKIFNSFDVLVFLSQQETFGLVIAEALSAGIPCVLSSIDAFEPFKHCPGVIRIDESQLSQASEYVNQLLGEKDKLKPLIQEYYRCHFSEPTITKQWNAKINECLANKKR